jgi:hypothetical protein
LVHLPAEFILVDPESLLTSTLLWGKSIDDTVVTLDLDHLGVVIGFGIGLRDDVISVLFGREVSECLTLVLSGRDNSEE